MGTAWWDGAWCCTPMGDKPPRAKVEGDQVPPPPAFPPWWAPLTCQGTEGEEEAMAAHGGAVGRRGCTWCLHSGALVLAPDGQDSCPLAPSAVPKSHWGGEGRGSTRGPPPAGSMSVCREARIQEGLELGLGAKFSLCLSFPMSCTEGCISLHRNPSAHGLWKRGAPLQAPQEVPVLSHGGGCSWGGEGAGKSHHVSLGSNPSPNPARPCVGVLGVVKDSWLSREDVTAVLSHCRDVSCPP